MTIYLRKTKDYWEWSDTLRTGYRWHSFTDGIKTRQDIINYFVEGGHQNRKGRYNAPEEIILVDSDNQPYTHYSVKLNHESGLHTATENYDHTRQRIFTTTQLWDEADQLQYLRESAVHLPRDVDRLKDAVEYLQAEEPFTIDQYRKELDQRLKEGIETRLRSGATTAVTEFQQ